MREGAKQRKASTYDNEETIFQTQQNTKHWYSAVVKFSSAISLNDCLFETFTYFSRLQLRASTAAAAVARGRIALQGLLQFVA